jgi:hypothetical protein
MGDIHFLGRNPATLQQMHQTFDELQNHGKTIPSKYPLFYTTGQYPGIYVLPLLPNLPNFLTSSSHTPNPSTFNASFNGFPNFSSIQFPIFSFHVDGDRLTVPKLFRDYEFNKEFCFGGEKKEEYIDY